MNWRNVEILKYWYSAKLKWWSAEFLTHYKAEMLKCGNIEMLKDGNFKVVKLWNYEARKLWNNGNNWLKMANQVPRFLTFCNSGWHLCSLCHLGMFSTLPFRFSTVAFSLTDIATYRHNRSRAGWVKIK